MPGNFVQCIIIYSYLSTKGDYIPKGPTNITFPPGSKRQLYNVTIVDDNIPENTEFFAADIVSISSPGFIIGSTKKPLIEILDFIDGEWVQC